MRLPLCCILETEQDGTPRKTEENKPLYLQNDAFILMSLLRFVNDELFADDMPLAIGLHDKLLEVWKNEGNEVEITDSEALFLRVLLREPRKNLRPSAPWFMDMYYTQRTIYTVLKVLTS